MQQAGDYITEEKRQALLAELKDLKGPKRKEILEALAYSKSLGDLSENAEYHQTREEQGKLEERIAKIEKILQSSQTVKGGGGEVIEIGSKVVVRKVGAKGLPAQAGEKKYVIVGSEEADMAKGKISNRSPIGRALFGKKKGDSVSFKAPNGLVDYKIIDVS
ncbi:MAG: Transcription elongation factor GreA [Candidatus Nomurabacteria bacterium GW2011_GWF2_43_8]|uniref:Transcription elongation factor GreA n=3 Tax=Candidatus Nomuraibacteriota TaxID=1752729 RepID=A0A0G1HYE9_9BACT|nr:MAG: Transcription elongation factor GreA [Candidatus Nomurabacteria bacterium GW2011_GWA2_43_15]KKT19110.1 MAG: Transcription elongation factor GreA [Candidatus Nomurabacteria bacterium GW2011_GWB1_43_7]KKT24647.1 MAG: Transcription elongation factor GreA [Candidatus Nomurabacteria bacterium GW2011_GWF2_43_8]